MHPLLRPFCRRRDNFKADWSVGLKSVGCKLKTEKRSWCSIHRRLPATEESSCGLRLCRRAYSHASHHKAQCFPWCRAFVFSIFMFTQWQNIPLLGVKHWCSRHENRSSAKSKWSATLQHCPSLCDVTLCWTTKRMGSTVMGFSIAGICLL